MSIEQRLSVGQSVKFAFLEEGGGPSSLLARTQSHTAEYDFFPLVLLFNF